MAEALSGAQKKALYEALVSAYPTYGDLADMLDLELGRNLAHYSALARLPTVVLAVIRYAEVEGWIDQLVTGASLGNPGNQQLRSLSEGGICHRDTTTRNALNERNSGVLAAYLPEAGVIGSTTAEQLERLVNAAVGFQDVVPYARGLIDRAARVCSISVVTKYGQSAGSGFLVGPDLVLTNYHVVADAINGGASASGISCIFDYRVNADGVLEHGEPTRLSEEWLVAASPPSMADLTRGAGLPSHSELDYAVIRLATDLGNAPLSSGLKRGWIGLFQTPPDIVEKLPLLILQHPKQNPIKIATDTVGVLAINDNRTRFTYGVNTEVGSSGSPCFTFDLKLVGLYHAAAGDERNEGVPISAIATHLRESGKSSVFGAQDAAE